MLGLDPKLMLALQFLAEQAMLPAAARLGAIHGEVGGAHQAFDGRTMVGRHRDPDRGTDIDVVTLQLERLADRQRDPPRNHLDLGHAFDLREEQRELVARQPRQQRPRQVGIADFGGHHYAQAIGHHHQQLIAASMTEAIVDRLEAVEVDEQHGRMRNVGSAQQFVGFGTEVQPIGKRGHRIVHTQRMGIFDRGADLLEQTVDGPRQLGVGNTQNGRRGRGVIAFLDRQQPAGQRIQRPCALAIGPLGSDVTDQQAERAGDDRSDDLLIEFRD